MKLTKQALEYISKSVRMRNLLALALDCSVVTINRYVDNNNDNLTKAAALKVIKEETGLSEGEILEVEAATQN